jgi:outer membrane protein OmpA-like peptidoglycan-associated protein
MTDRIPNEPISTAWSVLLAALGTVGSVACSYLVLDATVASSETMTLSDSTTLVASEIGETNQSSSEPSTTTTTTAPATTTSTEPEVDLDCPPLFVVNFEIGAATPMPDTIDDYVVPMADWLSSNPDTILLVEGHADSTGSEDGNLALSYRRAEAVVAELTAAGIPEDRLSARGLGQYQALVGEPPDSERNRRVTMQVPGYEACELQNPGSGGS